MTTPTNSNDWKPKHPREYRLFRIWKAIPVQLKTKENIDTDLFDDDDLRQVVKIRTQAELAVVLGVGEDTISDWNNRPVPEEFKDIDFHYWADGLAKDVVMAAYDAALDGKVPAMQLFLGLSTGYAERHVIDNPSADSVVSELSALGDLIKQLPDETNLVDNPGETVDNEQ